MRDHPQRLRGGIDQGVAKRGPRTIVQQTCGFFPAGTVVRLDIRPDADTSFLGWRGLPGCADASKITVFANVNIACQPGLQRKF